MNQEQIKNTIILSIIAVSIFAIYQSDGKKSGAQAAETEITSPKQQVEATDYFKGIELEAKAAYVLDLSANKAAFEKNSSAQLPLASITKIMTAIVAKEIYAPENKNLPASKFNSLMTAMLIESNNNAAITLAKSSETNGAINFIALMNKKAGELGLKQTIFSNSSGLDVSDTAAGAYGSAQDVAKLLVYGYQTYPDIFDQTKYPEVMVDGEKIINKNILTGKIPGILAGKTGLTDLAGGNLALIVQENNKLFAIIVLGSSEKGRFDDAEKLINATAQYSQQ